MTEHAVHVVCPSCEAVNRLPQQRLTEQPKCGKCHVSLFSGQAVELTDRTFTKFIERNDIPVVVDFWASWCGPCQAMGPAFAEAAGRLEPRVRFAKLNTETQQMTAGRIGIRSIPTMIMYRQGKEAARLGGAMTAADIVRWVQAQLAAGRP